MRSEHPELARPEKRCSDPLATVCWPWVLACGLLEPPRRDGENAQKTGKNGEKMGEIRPKRCEGRELTKDQLAVLRDGQEMGPPAPHRDRLGVPFQRCRRQQAGLRGITLAFSSGDSGPWDEDFQPEGGLFSANYVRAS